MTVVMGLEWLFEAEIPGSSVLDLIKSSSVAVQTFHSQSSSILKINRVIRGPPQTSRIIFHTSVFLNFIHKLLAVFSLLLSIMSTLANIFHVCALPLIDFPTFSRDEAPNTSWIESSLVAGVESLFVHHFRFLICDPVRIMLGVILHGGLRKSWRPFF